jgi:hypothetical protein
MEQHEGRFYPDYAERRNQDKSLRKRNKESIKVEQIKCICCGKDIKELGWPTPAIYNNTCSHCENGNKITHADEICVKDAVISKIHAGVWIRLRYLYFHYWHMR